MTFSFVHIPQNSVQRANVDVGEAQAFDVKGHSEVTLQKVQAVETKVVAKPSSSGPRKVTPQRKQNNRRAQQRYREKRKAQTTRLEQQVISLANELEALQVRHCTLNNCRRRGCELIFQSCNVLISMPTLVSQSATR
jgi:hypothetical protein